jgi:excisionase family DNA binding protein
MARQYWTLSEAAEALGVSDKTIRRRIRSGQIKAKMEHGQWFVEQLDIGETTVRQVSNGLELLRKQLEEKDRQIAELHVLLRQAQEQTQRLLPMPSKKHWWNPRDWFR